MDTLKNKILDIKKNVRDENSKKYLHINGSINYRKLLHDEILAADKKLLKKLNETKHIDPGCGKNLLYAHHTLNIEITTDYVIHPRLYSISSGNRPRSAIHRQRR